MDWEAEAIEKLQGYESRCRDPETIPRDLERLEASFTGIRSARLDGMPRAGSCTSAREDAMLDNITCRDRLKRRLEEARLWVSIVDGGLSALDDEERLVLELLFIHRDKGNIDRLCERLCVEKSTVYARRNKALRRFTIALYGSMGL